MAFRRRCKKVLFLAFILLFAIIAVRLKIAYAETPIFFSPSPVNVGSSDTKLPTTFSVNVEIGPVSDLYGWQINITYDPTIIQVVSVQLPSNNVFAGKRPITPNPVIDNVHGSLLYGANVGIGQLSYSGNGGVLCTIEFEALKSGISPLTFIKLPESLENKFPTRLYDSDFFDIPISYQDTQVNIQGYMPTQQLSRLEVSPSVLKVGGVQPPPVYFQVNITVFNVSDLMSLRFNITFSPSILKVVNITRPPGNIFSNANVAESTPIVDNENGFVCWNVSVISGSPFSGNGTVCTIEFQGVKLGISSIRFVENQTNLLDSTGQPISCDFQGSYVQVIQIFSCAVIEVSPYKINVTEPESYFLVNVTVTNVTDLYLWRINLEFNGTILKVYNYTIPPGNVFSDGEFRKYEVSPSDPLYDDTSENGFFIWGARITKGFSFYGNGVLCQITFRGVSVGSSNLSLSVYGTDTYLYDSAGNEINATIIDAGRPPAAPPSVKERTIELSYVLGPIGFLAGIVAIYLILKLRRRKIELSGAEPIYYNESK